MSKIPFAAQRLTETVSQDLPYTMTGVPRERRSSDSPAAPLWCH